MSDERKHPTQPDLTSPRYLGDGVYAWWDGYHVWLCVGSHDATATVALEPAVMEALVRYRAARLQADLEEGSEG